MRGNLVFAAAFALGVLLAATAQAAPANSCFGKEKAAAAAQLIRKTEMQRRIPGSANNLKYARDAACVDISIIMTMIEQKMAQNGGEYNADDVIIWYVDFLQKRAALYDAAVKLRHRLPKPKNVGQLITKLGLDKKQ